MGRAPRADIAGGIYHALNRGNARHDIFFKPEDFEAFERAIRLSPVLYHPLLWHSVRIEACKKVHVPLFSLLSCCLSRRFSYQLYATANQKHHMILYIPLRARSA